MGKMKYREILSSSIGSGLEFYDFIIFGFFASTFAPLFFPAENIFLSTLWGYTAFAIGFVFRPLGGLIFGHIGDKYGRKNALSSSIILMGTATLLIGILPTYNSIGIIAPLLLVFARILQGISAGGEYPGGMIFALEHSKTNKGFALSLVLAGTMSGTLLATIISYLSTIFPIISWRAPFILGFFVSFIGLYIRKKSDETDAFNIVKNNNRIEQYPIIKGMKKYPMHMVWIALASWFGCCAFVIQVIYLPSYIKTTSMIIDHALIDLSVIFVVIVSIITAPLSGLISDKVNKAFMAKIIIVLMSTLLLLTYSQLYSLNVTTFIICQFIYAILNGAIGAPLIVYLINSIESIEVKYSSYSFANGMGIILSGFCPLIATTLMNMENGHSLLGAFIFIMGILAVFSISKLNLLVKNKKNSFETVAYG